MDIQELKQEKAGLVKDMDKQVRKIEVNGGGESAEERRMLNAMETRIRVLESQIADEEKKLEIEAEHARRAFHGNGGNGNQYETASHVLGPQDSFRSYLERTGKIKHGGGYTLDSDEYQALSMGAFLRSVLVGPRTDLEKRALNETVLDQGGYTVPLILAATWLDALRPLVVTFAAGAQIIPTETQQTTIAKLVSDPVFSVVAEAGPFSTSGDPVFGAVILDVKKDGVIVKVSFELAQDAQNLDQMLNASFLRAARVEMERLAFNGNPNASPPEPRGLISTPGVNTIHSVGSVSSYDDLLAALQLLAEHNTSANAIVMDPVLYYAYAGLKEGTTNAPLAPPPALDGIPLRQTMGMPFGTMIAGDWRELVYGIRSEIRVQRLSELYAGTGEIGLLAWMRLDIAPTHAESFVVLDGATS